MNTFREILEPSAATRTPTGQRILGYILPEQRGAGDAVLTRFARHLIAQGVRVHGAAQMNSERRDGQRCDMNIDILPDGPRLRVSQSLGAGARGCRLDSSALEHAVVSATTAFGPQTDLLIVNKFGKQEACGGGFRSLIGEAVALGIPVLICVNPLNEQSFLDFSAGLERQLDPSETALAAWFTECTGASQRA